MPKWPGRGHCKWCAEVVPHPDGRPNLRRMWHDECAKTYRLAVFSNDQRRAIGKRDKGVCAGCGLAEQWQAANWHKAGGYMAAIDWEADHIRPLWSLPADVPLIERDRWWGLPNLQTLCVACHRQKTAIEAGRRAAGKSPQPHLNLICEAA